ncbi:hypothetical protein [Methanochimaera problematica]|uniref:hypothetical protein n=1 Tax=Methanochimaera problematica TaxID=2609417 RepID=UPI0029394AD1|nr:hypothetical protein [Methanoplanus sp. FWC-SCC4]
MTLKDAKEENVKKSGFASLMKKIIGTAGGCGCSCGCCTGELNKSEEKEEEIR